MQGRFTGNSERLLPYTPPSHGPRRPPERTPLVWRDTARGNTPILPKQPRCDLSACGMVFAGNGPASIGLHLPEFIPSWLWPRPSTNVTVVRMDCSRNASLSPVQSNPIQSSPIKSNQVHSWIMRLNLKSFGKWITLHLLCTSENKAEKQSVYSTHSKGILTIIWLMSRIRSLFANGLTCAFFAL